MGLNLTGPRYPLVVFDMDGTLTRELMDYTVVRREIAVPEKMGILEHIAGLGAEERVRADEILHRHEIVVAMKSTLHAGAGELLEGLQRRGVRTALLTRNSRACVEAVRSRHRLALDWVATREDLPHKPHGESLLSICRRFHVGPGQTLMVGDYLYDLQAAANAGADSALVYHQAGALPEFAAMARFVVRSLGELERIVFDTSEGAAKI